MSDGLQLSRCVAIGGAGAVAVVAYASVNDVGRVVNKFLTDHFAHWVDYEFTASMEEDLDRISTGELDRTRWLKEFYFGGGDQGVGLKSLVESLGESDPRSINSFEISKGVTLRTGVNVSGLAGSVKDGAFVCDGLKLDDGEVLPGLVVDAAGRSSQAFDWLSEAGIEQVWVMLPASGRGTKPVPHIARGERE